MVRRLRLVLYVICFSIGRLSSGRRIVHNTSSSREISNGLVRADYQVHGDLENNSS